MSVDGLDRRRRFRLALLAVGGVAFLVGGITVVRRGAVGGDPLAPVVTALGNDYILLALIGCVGLIVVVAVAYYRWLAGLEQTEPPDPEDVHDVAPPGVAFDEVVSARGLDALIDADRREAVRTRLREAAIATVIRESNCSRSAATERVRRGTWTDDDEAARFLTGDTDTGLVGRLAGVVGLDSPFQRAARRTAAEIVRRDPEEHR